MRYPVCGMPTPPPEEGNGPLLHVSEPEPERQRYVGQGALGHQHAAPELAHRLVALVPADRLDRDDAAVGLALRLALVEHGRARVDRVAVERRAAWRSDSISRFAIALPETSGTLMPSTSE